MVAGDDDEVEGGDDGEPFVVERSSGDGAKVRVAGVDDVVVALAEGFAEREVVLVNEEPGGHCRLRHQRPELFVIGDGSANEFGGDVVAVRDLLDCLACVEQLPEPFSGDALHARATEADEGIDHHW